MKVWLVHDSIYGNGKSLAEAMGAVFQEKIEMEIGHIRQISPRKVAQEKPDLIVVGTAIRGFSTSFASKKWIRSLKRELRKVNHVIPLGIVFVTHSMKKETAQFWGKRFHKLLERGIAIAEVYPEWLSGRVIDIKGPLEDGTIEEFMHIARQILDHIAK